MFTAVQQAGLFTGYTCVWLCIYNIHPSIQLSVASAILRHRSVSTELCLTGVVAAEHPLS